MSEEHARRVRSQGWDAHRAYWQEITNARPIPPARLQVPARAPVAVRARIVWERDGLELIDSTASYWTARDVLVDIRDPVGATSRCGSPHQTSRD